MAILQEYHRPESVDEAVALLARTDRRLAPLAGGSALVGALETHTVQVDGVVDLGRLGLDRITVHEQPERGEVLLLGATATLTDVSRHPVAGDLAGGLLRRAAQGEGPVNLRNAATVGGVVAAAEPDSEFYAALLALEAIVLLRDSGGEQPVPLADLARIQGLITGVQLPVHTLRGGAARIARTPSDRPIVAALAVVHGTESRVALCGVAPRPILQGQPLDPPDDFKAGADYRRAMAPVVARRALDQAQA